MVQHSEIQTVGFRLPAQLIWQGYQLAFPESWKASLLSLQSYTNENFSLPIIGLNNVLRLLLPEVLCVIPKAGKQHAQNWLVSEEPIDTQTLTMITRAWISQAYAKLPPSQLAAALNSVEATALNWQLLELDLGEWTGGKTKTAGPLNPLQFNILPAAVARLAMVDTFDFGAQGQRALWRAPAALGMELISWDPFIFPSDEGDYPWSCVFTFTTQVMPFDSRPVVYCHMGIRRWVIDPDTYFKGKSPTVYISASLPWFENKHGLSNTFGTTSVRLNRKTQPSTLQPQDNTVAILKTLGLKRSLPDFNAHRFHAMMDGGFAITFHNQFDAGSHRVGTGLMPKDRRSFMEQMESRLNPSFTPIAPYPRREYKLTHSKVFTGELNMYRVRNEDVPNISKIQAFRRQRLEEAKLTTSQSEVETSSTDLPKAHVTIEVLYIKDETCDVFLQTIARYFGLEAASTQPHTVGNLTITLRAQPLGNLGGPLELDSERSKVKDRIATAVRKRVTEIKDTLSFVSEATLTFVELPGKEHFVRLGSGTDPKTTIRRALAMTGRHSQFFDFNSDASPSERAFNSLLDGLRQLALNPPLPIVDQLPLNLFVVGLYIIHQNKKTSASGQEQFWPVFVGLELDPLSEDPTIGIPWARLPGCDGWIRYDEALLKLGSETMPAYKDEKAAEAFIAEVVKSLPDDTVLICQTQNARQVWKYLQQATLTRDHIAFGNEEPYSVVDIQQPKRLRLILVRNDERNETPEWYVPEAKFSKGLFTVSDRVFASTYGMVVMQQTPDFTRFNERPTVAKRAWNPGLYEITVVAMQKNDHAHLLASLVHSLRESAIQYKEATALPLPLHLAQKMREYLLNVELEEEEPE